MREDLKQIVGLIIKTVDEINIHKNNFIKIRNQIYDLDNKLNNKSITKAQFNSYVNKITRGKTKDEFITFYEQKILGLLGNIDKNVTTITSSFSKKDEVKERKPIYEEVKVTSAEVNLPYIKELIKKRKKKKL